MYMLQTVTSGNAANRSVTFNPRPLPYMTVNIDRSLSTSPSIFNNVSFMQLASIIRDIDRPILIIPDRHDQFLSLRKIRMRG
jgi:hypothetical protein